MRQSHSALAARRDPASTGRNAVVAQLARQRHWAAVGQGNQSVGRPPVALGRLVAERLAAPLRRPANPAHPLPLGCITPHFLQTPVVMARLLRSPRKLTSGPHRVGQS
jgi:hypothetical protein